METPFIPVAKPFFDESEHQALTRVLSSGWVTQGPEVAALEAEFKKECGAGFAVGVSSGTDALVLALRAAGVKKGDRVVCPSHSFIATANSIVSLGAVPVFVDIEPNSPNVGLSAIQEALTLQPKAILLVHQTGMPCSVIASLSDIPPSIPVIEDAACAFGSEIEIDGAWEPIGRPHGEFACFSFHPRKLLVSGEGGMITGRTSESERFLKQVRQHGMSRSAYDRSNATQRYERETYQEFGLNHRMSDLNAALAREQLKKIPAFVAERRRRVAIYQEELKNYHALWVDHEPKGVKTNWQSFSIQLETQAKAESLQTELLEKRIATRPGVMCAHLEPVMKGRFEQIGDLNHSVHRSQTSLILPLFHSMTDQQQGRVIEVIQDWARSQ